MWITTALALLALPQFVSNEPPWVVVHAGPSTTHGSPRYPQIVVMPNGAYVATFTSIEHPPTPGMRLYCSTDDGSTWKLRGELPLVRGGTLVSFGEELWMLGIEDSPLPVVARRSMDLGATWSAVEDKAHGALDRPPRVFANAETALVYGGRIWRTITNWYLDSDDSTPIYYVRVASASLATDVLDAANWTISPNIRIDLDHADEELCTLQLASTAHDEIGLFYAHRGPGREIARGPVDPRALEWVRSGVDRGLPPESLSRRIARDEPSKRFPALIGVRRGEPFGLHREYACHVLSLWTSEDLVTWTTSGLLLRDATYDHFRVRAADWAIDGDDLLVLANVRRLDGQDAKSVEQIVFLRVPKFRERTAWSLPLVDAPTPK